MKMKNMQIEIDGIETNNLKGIDVSIDKNCLNVIIGPSGSGKSSLAYDTIAQIGMHEYMSMFNDNAADPLYKVKKYKNMIATVPIRQTNHNNNMRSSIGTYFGLNSAIASLFASLLGVDIQQFALSKEENACEACHGLGYIEKPDASKIINYRKKLKDNPFKCWTRYSDFYSRILKKVCEEKRIDVEKSFNELTQSERDFLLYGSSENKFHIVYKHNGASSSRTTKYYGVMTNEPMLKDRKLPGSYYSKCTCEFCRGMKYSKDVLALQVCGISIGSFMNTPFGELGVVLDRFNTSASNEQQQVINTIRRFVDKANELFLGHLYFNRAIPTLSGGEMQRLRLIQVFNTQLADLAIILDEPLAGLSGEEKAQVYENILKLSKSQTLIVVDHSEVFYNHASKIIALGPGSGIQGGNLIDAQEYILQQRMCSIEKSPKQCSIKKIKAPGTIYSYRGIDVSIAEKGLTLIFGRSGVGKSTLLREYFPRIVDNYLYIDQKPAEGNVNSNVATLLDLAGAISKIFAEKYCLDRTFFSNASGKEGVCPRCLGKGYNEFGNVALVCKECNGTGFNKILKKYNIFGKNIFQIYGMTISEAKDFFEKNNRKIHQKLKIAEGLLLGHLQLGQKTATLSGGENIRIKLMQAEGRNAQVIGIDEPFKGLNRVEINKVVEYFWQLRERQITVIVIDHTEGTEQYFDYLQRLTIDKKGYIKGNAT